MQETRLTRTILEERIGSKRLQRLSVKEMLCKFKNHDKERQRKRA